VQAINERSANRQQADQRCLKFRSVTARTRAMKRLTQLWAHAPFDPERAVATCRARPRPANRCL